MFGKKQIRRAFTLIELSIVLLVMAVLVAGLLIGRRIVIKAKVDKTLADMRTKSMATDQFQDAYQFLPGDFMQAKKYFGVNSKAIEVFDGNGDGIIGGGIAGAEREGVQFWAHLIASDIISDKLSASIDFEYNKPRWYEDLINQNSYASESANSDKEKTDLASVLTKEAFQNKLSKPVAISCGCEQFDYEAQIAQDEPCDASQGKGTPEVFELTGTEQCDPWQDTAPANCVSDENFSARVAQQNVSSALKTSTNLNLYYNPGSCLTNILNSPLNGFTCYQIEVFYDVAQSNNYSGGTLYSSYGAVGSSQYNTLIANGYKPYHLDTETISSAAGLSVFSYGYDFKTVDINDPCPSNMKESKVRTFVGIVDESSMWSNNDNSKDFIVSTDFNYISQAWNSNRLQTKMQLKDDKKICYIYSNIFNGLYSATALFGSPAERALVSWNKPAPTPLLVHPSKKMVKYKCCTPGKELDPNTISSSIKSSLSEGGFTTMKPQYTCCKTSKTIGKKYNCKKKFCKTKKTNNCHAMSKVELEEMKKNMSPDEASYRIIEVGKNVPKGPGGGNSATLTGNGNAVPSFFESEYPFLNAFFVMDYSNGQSANGLGGGTSSPEEMRIIDEKSDDGVPCSGKVRAFHFDDSMNCHTNGSDMTGPFNKCSSSVGYQSSGSSILRKPPCVPVFVLD